MSDRGGKNPLRKKAEKILSKGTEPRQKISSLDSEKLIHELQVHQIELEMQNDELRLAQEEIEKSRRKYVNLYDFAPVGYFTLDKEAVIIEANLTGAGLLGVERTWLYKTPFSAFIMPECLSLFGKFWRNIFENPGRKSRELRLKRKAGDPLWVGLESMAVEAPNGNLIGIRVALMDITEQKRSEEALRESEKRLQDLSSQLLNIQELERKAIAIELHDRLLSDLAGLNLSLGGKISTLEETGHPLGPDLRKLLKIIQRMMQETRGMMNRLRPSILDELGVIPAIQGLCREFEELHPHIGVECKIEAKEDEIPDSIKVAIFRVAQQAMANSAQHGNGTSAKIFLRKSLDRIEFIVEDNGQGFNLENIKMGVGLQSMRERVQISGGEFQLESKKGQGTTIRATWSCSKQKSPISGAKIVVV